MKITDLNGYPIEVTDLKEAIRITKRYTQYRHEDKSYTDFDKRQNGLLDGYVREANSNKRTSKQPLKFKNDEHEFFQSDNTVGFYR